MIKSMNFKLYSLYILLVVFLMSSCSAGDDCREDMDVKMNVELYTTAYDEINDEVVINRISLPLTVLGVGLDTLLYDRKTISEFDFYLRDTERETKIAIMDTMMTKDTITLYYENVEEFISLECGCLVKKIIEDVAVTTNMLDSVVIKDKLVTEQEVVNLRLYIKNR